MAHAAKYAASATGHMLSHAEKLERARHTIAYLLNILKEKLPEIYAAVTQRNSPVADQTPEQKPKPKRNRDMER